MELLEMVYDMNPQLLVKPERFEIVNFERPEIPIGRGHYSNNYQEFESADHLGLSVDRLLRIQKSQNEVDMHDLMNWAREEAWSAPPKTLIPERIVASKLAKRRGPIENTGQIYENMIIGNMFNNAVRNHKKGVEEAREITEKAIKEQAQRRRR